ncbi:MAG: ATP-binding protein [Alkalispirochaeta sp.]
MSVITQRTDQQADQLLDFAADDSLAGFRLHRLELYNWGTFHNRIWTLAPHGKNALLTGEIGSGKSTIVDAVNALLVPPGRLSFNKAAGAERRERDLRSYVLGYYRSQRTSEGATARPVALRDRKALSVILAVFVNEGFSQTVTLAQVYRMKENQGQPERFYIVADRDLSIRDDILPYGSSIKQLRKTLRDLPDTDPVYQSFSQYSAAFRRRFGLKGEQALMLFHQTVSMKSVGNLTLFVREHMLEPSDVAGRIEALINHFEDLYRAHEAVVTAKKQIARLGTIETDLTAYRAAEHQAATFIFARESLAAYFAHLRSGLLEKRIETRRAESAKLTARRASEEEKLRTHQNERERISEAIAANGGDRLAELERERAGLTAEKERRLGAYRDYRTGAAPFDLADPVDPDTFTDNLTRIETLQRESRARADELVNTLTERGGDVRAIKERHDELSAEITSLQSRRSNIPARQIAIRDRLCEAVGAGQEEIPFVGELLRVRDTEKKWEGAIERVLHSFGLSLLVPADRYAAVSEWVDATHLNGRLIYYRVRDEEEPQYTMEPDEDALVRKIEVKGDTPHHSWLTDRLQRRFDYRCTASLTEFRRAERAITPAGHIKGSPHRHEKDDRHRIDDRSRFILGWTNKDKIGHLKEQQQQLETELAAAAGSYTEIQKEHTREIRRGEQLAALAAARDFTTIDWKTPARRIETVETEITQLRDASDVLETLTAQRRDVDEQITSVTAALERIKENQTINDERRSRDEELLQYDREILSETAAPIDKIIQTVGDIYNTAHSPGELPDTPITIENADKRQSELRNLLQAKIDAEQKRITRINNSLIEKMHDFRREYPVESQELDASVDGGDAFLELLHRLRSDNLPQFEARFKRLLNENTIREIANFQAQLNKESETILERVETINRSLASIDYESGRYIRLEAEPSIDQEIRTFRQDLKACTTGTIGGPEDEQYTETKFEQVKAIIDRFRGREGTAELDRRWTDKVTDVRSWYTFAASVRWREDDSEYEHHTDSDGKSGGQKEKLAYTVLAASVAYQFGLEWGETRSRSFRCVVIDEAFGKGSDESAKYGLDLFKRLNLQLVIVTPLTKLHIIEPHVSTVGFVSNPEGTTSVLRTLTIEEYQAERQERDGRNEQHGPDETPWP